MSYPAFPSLFSFFLFKRFSSSSVTNIYKIECLILLLIGMIYGEAKVCIYDACYYCYECHVDDEHVIPARVIHNWDFRKHRVARHTKLFLLQIEEEPLFNVDETNPTLYNVIKELHEVKARMLLPFVH